MKELIRQANEHKAISGILIAIACVLVAEIGYRVWKKLTNN